MVRTCDLQGSEQFPYYLVTSKQGDKMGLEKYKKEFPYYLVTSKQYKNIKFNVYDISKFPYYLVTSKQ